MTLAELPKALFFDVFGTCVDWRTPVKAELCTQARSALESPTSTLPGAVRTKVSDMNTSDDWGEFAQQWRNSYMSFVLSIAADPTLPYKTIDQHHLDSLKVLVQEWGFSGLWTEAQLLDLSLVWHRLTPWPDTAEGLRLLNGITSTATLSNANIELLRDLNDRGDMAFQHVLSAEMFASYKPSPKVYLGAAGKLGYRPEECAMVAAHLGDLKAARGCGLRTIYVERVDEEGFSEDEIRKAKDEGWVDLWVGQADDGFVAVFNHLNSLGRTPINASL